MRTFSPSSGWWPTAARALSVGEPELALARLDAALALWRGAAYEDFGDHAFARAEAARLDELRLTAVETRLQARLALAAPGVPDGAGSRAAPTDRASTGTGSGCGRC